MELNYSIICDNSLKQSEMVENLIKQLNLDCDQISFDFEESSLDYLLEELNTIPFLSDYKIVIISNPTYLYEPAKYNESLISKLKKYYVSPSESTIFITRISNYKAVDIEFKNLIEKNTIVLEEEEINPEELLDKEIEKEHFEIDSNAKEELLKRVKDDLYALKNELDKLILYKYDEKKIKLEDIYTLSHREPEDNAYLLVNALMNQNKKEVYDIYLDLIESGADEGGILYLIINKMQELYEARILMDSSMTKSDIASILHISEGKAYYLMKDAKKMSVIEIKNKINKLVDIEYKYKVGEIDKKLALDLFLLI